MFSAQTGSVKPLATKPPVNAMSQPLDGSLCASAGTVDPRTNSKAHSRPQRRKIVGMSAPIDLEVMTSRERAGCKGPAEPSFWRFS